MSAAGARKLVHERFGGVALALETLADLDAAVDELLARTEERPDELERDLCPYFGVLWPAARALAGELARRDAALAGVRVLELGCGLALPSLVAARLGAHVTATDLHPDVPAYLARNLALNDIGADALVYRELDWRAAGDPRVSVPEFVGPGFDFVGAGFDLVVASDVLYEAGHPAPVARALAAYAGPRGRILLADPGRAYLQACLDALSALGFRATTDVVAVADPSLDRAGDVRTREVFLIELARGI